MNKLIFAILTAISVNTFAGNQSCMQKYTLYVDATISWQNQSTALIINTLPQYMDLANYYREVQLSAIKLRKLAVKLALKNFPDEINTDSKLNQWIDLSPDLEAKLSKNSTEYLLGLQKYNDLKNRPPNENGDQFRTAFKETLTQGQEFQALLSEFKSKVAKIEAIKCTKA